MAASGNVDLVTQIKYKIDGGYHVEEFTYNKKGLLIRKDIYENDALVRTVTYKYNSDNLVKSAKIEAPGFYMGIYSMKNTYSGKKLTKRVCKHNSNVINTTTEKYSYKGGLLTKASRKTTGQYGSSSEYFYSFNKKGLLTKIREEDNYGSYKTKFNKYDKNGYIEKITFDTDSWATRKYTYKNGKLTEYKQTSYNGYENKKTVESCFIQTKTVSVLKGVSAIVAGQQQEIINTTQLSLPCGTNMYLGI